MLMAAFSSLRHKHSFTRADSLINLVLCATLLGLALLAAPLARPDLRQDYAAACAWWVARYAENPFIVNACGNNLSPTSLVETAHPPAATLVSLPLALLGWPQAYYAWIVLGALCVGLSWVCFRIPFPVCLATAPFVYLCLHRGAFEPLLFLLMALSLHLEERRPGASAALIGLAAGLKVYPVLLLTAFLWRRRYYELILALLCGLGITVAAEIILGPGVIRSWLRFTPGNLDRYINNPDNVSLVRVVPDSALAFPVALVIYLLLILGLRRQLCSAGAMRELIPVMLMTTPLVWSHYLGALALASLRRAELLLLGGGGILLVLSSMSLVPIDSAVFVYAPLFAATAIAWLRVWRRGAHCEPADQPTEMI